MPLKTNCIDGPLDRDAENTLEYLDGTYVLTGSVVYIRNHFTLIFMMMKGVWQFFLFGFLGECKLVYIGYAKFAKRIRLSRRLPANPGALLALVFWGGAPGYLRINLKAISDSKSGRAIMQVVSSQTTSYGSKSTPSHVSKGVII